MHEASLVGNAKMLKLMLDAGGNPNAAFGEGETVLMTAARAGDAESVRALLEHGGDPNAAEGWHGQTALMWAAMEDHADVVKLLIEHGAEVDRPFPRRTTGRQDQLLVGRQRRRRAMSAGSRRCSSPRAKARSKPSTHCSTRAPTST